MSDDRTYADENEDGTGDEPTGSSSPGASIFDLFEPPPETSADHLGPIPVIPDPDDAPDDDLGGDFADDDPTPGDLIDDTFASLGEQDTTTIAPSLAAEVDFLGFEPTRPVEGGGAFSAGPGGAHLIDEAAASTDDRGLDDASSAADPGDPLSVFAPDEGDADTDLSGPDLSDSEDAGTDLPHWTEPATGTVPKVVAIEREGPDLTGPRWHGDGPQWAGDDLAEVFADEAGVAAPKMVQIDAEGDFSSALPSAAGSPQRQAVSSDPRTQRAQQRLDAATEPSGRNVPQAIGVGVAFAAVAAVAFWAGAFTSIVLIAAVAGLAAGEFFGAIRRAHLHGAALLGIVGAAALPIAVYNRGDAGFTLVLGLAVVFGAIWYLVGADVHRPVMGMSLTMLGIAWIGGLAAFAALLIAADQISMLVATIIITVASDTGAYAGGKALGNPGHPFHPVSPNKTWEGTIVGLVCAVGSGLILGLAEVSPFADDLIHALLLGAVVGVLGPIGDLTESMVKRDLGIKDMGAILPGHGGLLDRLDALLFALPGTYYLARLLDLI